MTEHMGMAVVIRGTLDSGFTLIGPFVTWDDADEWSNKNPGDYPDWIKGLEDPQAYTDDELRKVTCPNCGRDVHPYEMLVCVAPEPWCLGCSRNDISQCSDKEYNEYINRWVQQVGAVPFPAKPAEKQLRTWLRDCLIDMLEVHVAELMQDVKKPNG